jgi:hypothetical protein
VALQRRQHPGDRAYRRGAYPRRRLSGQHRPIPQQLWAGGRVCRTFQRRGQDRLQRLAVPRQQQSGDRLADAAHTRDEGYRANTSLFLNDAGQAAGLAYRYNGAASTGQSAWFHSGSNTQAISLTGAAYTRDDGYQANTVKFLNIPGQAAGYAERFNGATCAQNAWSYDPFTNQTYSMYAAVPVSMTYSDSYIMYLGNDGLALGYYSRFDAGGTNLGTGAFSFSVADGWNDLGSLVNGGLDTAGWQQLGEAYHANGAGQIIGNGFLAGMNGGAVFLLTPVPEPETWAMLLAGLGLVGAAVGLRRTRSASGFAGLSARHAPRRAAMSIT